MRRREFLKTTAAAAGAVAAGMPVWAAGAPDRPVRGVNLGGWLVLEKWMTPSLFAGTQAEDEYNLGLELGGRTKARLDRHRETFITAEDFRWIKDCGLNAVRLPVGYWLLDGPAPYVEAARFADFAFEQAHRHGLGVLLDLHGAPGSQNGWAHSGREGKIDWPVGTENVRRTVDILESFARRYGKHPALWGIELLNEPRNVVPLAVLKPFYQDAYARLRALVGPSVRVVMHDSFRALAWEDFMRGPAVTNVLLDTHLYQSFTDEDTQRTAAEQLTFARARRRTLAEMERKELPVIVGEWSLALPQETVRGLTPAQDAALRRDYAAAQLASYRAARGWFFWSYKLESRSEWNFRHCLESGWLPADCTA